MPKKSVDYYLLEIDLLKICFQQFQFLDRMCENAKDQFMGNHDILATSIIFEDYNKYLTYEYIDYRESR